MKIRVLLFAVLRDAAGAAEVDTDVPPGATLSEVAARLIRQFPALAPYLPRIVYAVNRSYAKPETRLSEGDEVALIPPVSGG